MAILTTAHAQLTRGRQEILISGPKIKDSLGHVDRDIPPLKKKEKNKPDPDRQWTMLFSPTYILQADCSGPLMLHI